MSLTPAQITALKTALAAAIDGWAAGLTPDTPTQPGDTGKFRATVTPIVGGLRLDWQLPTDAKGSPLKAVSGFSAARGGVDSTGHADWATALASTVRSITFDKLTAGSSYPVSVTAMYADGTTERVDLVGVPLEVTSPNPPGGPITGGGKLGAVTKNGPGGFGSGFPFASVVFQGGEPNRSTIQAYATARGRRADGALTFPDWKTTWDNLGDLDGVHDILEAGGVTVMTLPFAPEPEGPAMVPNAANGKYAQQWRELGGHYALSGVAINRMIIRLGWEFDGEWYPWMVQSTAQAPVWAAAYHRIVTDFRAGAADALGTDHCDVLFDYCVNGGAPKRGASLVACYPGDDVVDVVSVDQYDMWPPAVTSAAWEAKMATPNSIRTVAAFARAHGKLWAIGECGNAHGNTSDYGQDNPAYWDNMFAEVRKQLKIQSNMAYWTDYRHSGAPGTLAHDWASNPRSYAAFKNLITQPLP